MAPEATPTGQNPEEIKATGGAVAEDIQDKGTGEEESPVTAQEKAQDPGDAQNEPAEKAAQGKSGAMQAEAKTAQFSPVQDSGKSSVQRGLDFILDIPLQITVELGRAQMLINDLLQLGQGSVVELSKLAGEPMEVLVNQKLIARGEVVVVNEKFGIRLTDIISPLERVEKLS
jgi:flagellar motor switch protein FliN/FliY